MASINQDQVGAYPIPLAPANEQDRIVSKIEELFSDLDAGVAALERIRANLKRYRAAVLKSAVEGKLTEASRHWKRMGGWVLVAETSNTAVAPRLTDWLVGCMVGMG